jgi:1-deoxy-D-xylulose 5-phosphate reductoisomerase
VVEAFVAAMAERMKSRDAHGVMVTVIAVAGLLAAEDCRAEAREVLVSAKDIMVENGRHELVSMLKACSRAIRS